MLGSAGTMARRRSSRGRLVPRVSRDAELLALAGSVQRLSAVLTALARSRELQAAGVRSALWEREPERFAAEVAQTAAAVACAAALLPLARCRPVLGELQHLACAHRRLHEALAELQGRVPAALGAFRDPAQGVQPIDALYESLLEALDRNTRRSCGVYFTPSPVTAFIVRAVHTLLQQELGLSAGLADTTCWGTLCERQGLAVPEGADPEAPFVCVIDPACGTGAFLVAALERMQEEVMSRAHSEGLDAGAARARWKQYAGAHLPGRLQGLDILAAPCAVARMRLESKLRETGCDLAGSIEVRQADALSPETWGEPAMRRPGTVILGNPPFAGAAPTASRWMEQLMLDYKRSVRQQERQMQRLSNQYVRFLRLAEWRVRASGIGAVGLITDRGWLDGLLFGDVRRCFFSMAQRIHVIDLGGGTARRPAQAVDENLFAIRQPVAITCAILRAEPRGSVEVRRAVVRGSRLEKLSWLEREALDSPGFERVGAGPWAANMVGRGPWSATYERWPSLLDILGTGDRKRDRALWLGTGFKTRHDGFVVGMSPAHAVELVQRLAHRREPDEVLRRELGLCSTAHFDLAAARALSEQPARVLRSMVRRIAYRPLDWRWVVWARAFICEPKTRTMRHLLHEGNLCLAVLRRDRTGLGCGAFAARGLVAKDLVSNVDDALVWPMMVETGEGLAANVQPRFWQELDRRTGCGRAEVQEVLGYIYGVLWSPAYRERWGRERCADYPRIPYPRAAAGFRAVAKAGLALCRAHLLEDDAASWAPPHQLRPGVVVHEVRYDPEAERALIGRGAWIHIPAQAWAHVVGAHPVCQSWLNARRGQRLGGREIGQLLQVVGATWQAGRLAAAVDACIEHLGGWEETFSAEPGPG